MNKFLLLLISLAISINANSQVTPNSKVRSNNSFTQVDEYLSVIKRFGIPTANKDTVDGLTSGPNSVKLIYNTDVNKLRLFNPISKVWYDAVDVPLVPINEGKGIGYRIKGFDPDFYGDIGLNAKDLSSKYTLPNTAPFLHLANYVGNFGATGRQSFVANATNIAQGNETSAFGLGNAVIGSASMATGQGNQILSLGGVSFVSGIQNLNDGQSAFISGDSNKNYAGRSSILGGKSNEIQSVDSYVSAIIGGTSNLMKNKSSSSLIASSLRAEVYQLNNAVISGNETKIYGVASSALSDYRSTNRGQTSSLIATSRSEIDTLIYQSSIIASSNSKITKVPNTIGGQTSVIIASDSSVIHLGQGTSQLKWNNAIIAGEKVQVNPGISYGFGTGQGTRVTASAQVAIGLYNADEPHLGVTNPLKKSFIIGGGGNVVQGSSFDRKNVLYVQHNGLMWIEGMMNAKQYKLNDLNTAPSSATDTGVKGEIRVTSTHIYVCIATNTWVRTLLETWQ